MKSILLLLGLFAYVFGNVVLEPTQDTYANIVAQDGLCAYRGSEPAMFSGKSGFGNIISTAYVLFDLTGVSSVPSAIFNLTAGCNSQGNVVGNQHTLDRVAIGWTESTLSGTSIAGLSGCPNLPSVITSNVVTGTVSASGVLSASVTSAVSAALSSGAVALSIRYINSGSTNFCVRTTSPSSSRPKLIIG